MKVTLQMLWISLLFYFLAEKFFCLGKYPSTLGFRAKGIPFSIATLQYERDVFLPASECTVPVPEPSMRPWRLKTTFTGN